MRRVFAAIAAAVLLVSGSIGAVSAAADQADCAADRVIEYALNVPGGTWSLGRHDIVYSMTLYDAGTPNQFSNHETLTVSRRATAYSGVVQIQLYSIVGLRLDGSLDVDVHEVLPSQPTRLSLHGLYYPKTDTSLDFATVSIDGGAPITLAKGPSTVVCAPGGTYHIGGFFVRNVGWAN
jgi:hypothetical protein